MTCACPDCRLPLDRQVFRGIQIDYCAACGGIWFDSGELPRLMQSDPAALVTLEDDVVPQQDRPQPPAPERECPVCHVPMHRSGYRFDSPIEVDICAHCHGMWIEDGELRQIQEWADAHRDSRRVAAEGFRPA